MNTPQHIVLIGFPNAGKTSLFNQLTGLDSKTVNYPGSTVKFEMGTVKKNPTITLVDLPGIQSFSPDSEDEKLTIDALTHLDNYISSCTESKPSLVIGVVDATQRSRHLALLKELLDKGYPTVIALTKTDQAKKQKKTIDAKKAAKRLGCPVVHVDNKTGHNIDLLLTFCLLQLKSNNKCKVSEFSHTTLEKIQDNYRWAESVIKDTQFEEKTMNNTKDWDTFLLHPFWGPISFISIMSLFFYSIFALGAPLMDGIDQGIAIGAQYLTALWPTSSLVAFITEALGTGLAAVLVFVPQIAILFIGVGILEETGYLARGAVIVDQPLSKVGLNGRCFVPLLSGCACAIPAMLAARNIPHHKTRLLCLFTIPLMQCSARLPVYGLLLALLFPHSPLLSGLTLTAIYLGSMVMVAIVSAIGAKAIGLSADHTHFSIELPAWRLPIWRNIWKQTVNQTKSFVVNAGPIIMGVAIMLWVLSVFPSEEHSFAMSIGRWVEPLFWPMGVDWRVGVAILLSFAAREVFVSALVVLFAVGGNGASLLTSLQSAVYAGSQTPIFTTPVIVGLILFFMIALQCGTTVAVARKEMGGWKWPMIQLGGFIGGAYILASLAVQVLRLF